MSVILNVFPTFAVGGSQVRFATLANSPGHDFRQQVFAIDGRYDCFERLRTNGNVSRSQINFPRAGTASNVVAAHKTLRKLNPALLVTYNWGAIEWALAAGFTNIPYLHVVDGFDSQEAKHQLARRIWFRRLALARCSGIVVPSQSLYRIAREMWRLPEDRICFIPNGVDVEHFARPPDERLLVGLGLPRGQPIVGTVASLRPEKNLGRLLQAVAQTAKRVPLTLVIVGDGSERCELESQAVALGLGTKVIFTGAIEDPARLLGAFDVFALSSDTEQMPISVLEAMATGLPIAGIDVGDVKEIVSPENRPFIVSRDSTALAGALLDLLSASTTRSHIGEANKQRVFKEYTLDRMVKSYSDLYRSLLSTSESLSKSGLPMT